MTNIWGMTDIGLVRRENQDAYAVLQEQMEKEIAAIGEKGADAL